MLTISKQIYNKTVRVPSGCTFYTALVIADTIGGNLSRNEDLT